MRKDDYTELKEMFPGIKDFFHINGKYVFWGLGEDARERLRAAGFRAEPWGVGKTAVYDRSVDTRNFAFRDSDAKP